MPARENATDESVNVIGGAEQNIATIRTPAVYHCDDRVREIHWTSYEVAAASPMYTEVFKKSCMNNMHAINLMLHNNG